MNVKPEHLVLGALVAAGGLLFIAAGRQAGGFPLPAAPVTEALYTTPDPLAAIYLYNPNLNKFEQKYTRHRYPDRVGGELTTAIHYGHSRLAVPDERDKNWITCPPSEVTI